jgi:hypothetical protein
MLANLKFSLYDDDYPRLLVGRTTGNEILAVRVTADHGYTETFDDSRHADRAISEAKQFLRD